MKKKIISTLLCASMVATMAAGCGGSSDTTSTDNSNSGAAAPATESGSDAAETDTTGDEGKVFNIYCWNEEFKSRLTDHYPGYEEVDVNVDAPLAAQNLRHGGVHLRFVRHVCLQVRYARLRVCGAAAELVHVETAAAQGTRGVQADARTAAGDDGHARFGGG